VLEQNVWTGKAKICFGFKQASNDAHGLDWTLFWVMMQDRMGKRRGENKWHWNSENVLDHKEPIKMWISKASSCRAKLQDVNMFHWGEIDSAWYCTWNKHIISTRRFLFVNTGQEHCLSWKRWGFFLQHKIELTELGHSCKIKIFNSLAAAHSHLHSFILDRRNAWKIRVTCDLGLCAWAGLLGGSLLFFLFFLGGTFSTGRCGTGCGSQY
jgi:hypothetical protein